MRTHLSQLRNGLLGRVTVAGALLAAVLVATPAHAELSSALETRLAHLPADDHVAVVAVMNAQVDGTRFEERTAALLRALRTTATRSQDDVVDEIDGPVRSFWLVNAIAFTGTADEIRTVADHPAVAEVTLDQPVQVTESADITATPYPDAGGGNWGLEAINAPAAWSTYGLRGDGVRIGNIDTGVAADHPDLAGRVVAWRDFVNGRPTPYDDNGHGTHTVGTAAGGASGGGPIGVAPGAQLVVAKAIGANGGGSGSAILAAAEWMTDPDGNPATADYPAVISNSWSSTSANDPWFRPMVRRWRELGIVPVFSAGNNGPGPQTINSPASYPDVIAVGALDRTGAPAPFTARGPVIWQNVDGLGPNAGTTITKPDVAAPGVNIVSSVGNGYLSYSGTSMAAPHVAGLVALLRQANRDLSVDAIADILRASAQDVGAPGPDFQTGAGRVDAARALALVSGAALTPTPAAPVASAPSTGSGANASPAKRPVGALGPVGVTQTRSGARLRFTVHAPDSDAKTLSAARWDFGDGDTATGRNVIRRFADDAPRRARVAITDATGSTRQTRFVIRRTAGAPVSRLRVPRTMSRARGSLVIRGINRSGARLRVRMMSEAPAARTAGQLATGRSRPTTVARSALRLRRGAFRLSLPVRGAQPGLYRIELTVGATRSVRTVRLR